MTTIKRKPDLRRIKTTFSYSVAELAKALNRKDSSIYRWIEDGLPTIDDKSPALIHGSVVHKWINQWWLGRKHKCSETQIYCPTCHVPSEIVASTISIVQLSNGPQMIKAECCGCGNMINRYASAQSALNFVRACTGIANQIDRSNDPGIFPNNGGSMMKKARADSPAKKTTIFNPKNERLIRRYLEHRAEAEGVDIPTLQKTRKSLRRYEECIDFKDILGLNTSDAKKFKLALRDEKISLTLKLWTIAAVRMFFQWLYSQPGYKAKISSASIQYLSLSRKEVKAVETRLERQVAELAEVTEIILAMPDRTPIERRNKAMMAFLAITGVRATALISLKLKHFEPDDKILYQTGGEVDTKFGKTIITPLLPIDDRLEDVFLSYFEWLKSELGFGREHPLFPAPKMGHTSKMLYEVQGLSDRHWDSTVPLRKIVGEVFSESIKDRVLPHDFRRMIASEALRRGLSLDAAAAWSAALGHNDLAVTVKTYAKITPQELARQARRSGQSANSGDDNSKLRQIQKIINETAE
jgi:site-specific recombinase XerD